MPDIGSSTTHASPKLRHGCRFAPLPAGITDIHDQAIICPGRLKCVHAEVALRAWHQMLRSHAGRFLYSCCAATHHAWPSACMHPGQLLPVAICARGCSVNPSGSEPSYACRYNFACTFPDGNLGIALAPAPGSKTLAQYPNGGGNNDSVASALPGLPRGGQLCALQMDSRPLLCTIPCAHARRASYWLSCGALLPQACFCSHAPTEHSGHLCTKKEHWACSRGATSDM